MSGFLTDSRDGDCEALSVQLDGSTSTAIHCERESHLQRALAEVAQEYSRNNPQSERQHRRAQLVFPGGHTRQTLFHQPFPLTIAHGDGSTLVDVDGHRYTNFLGDYSAGLYGHTPAEIQEAIIEAVRDGVSLGGVTAKEVELAELITSRFRSIEQIRFCHSGSEACVFAVLLARHATKRKKILVFNGAYHGGFMSYAERPSALNVPFEFVSSVYNDLGETLRVIAANADTLAAIMVEPMAGSGGCIPARIEFLAMLRQESTRYGLMLIFDEVMTSRLGPEGAQGLFGIAPDITTLGKYWGGGFGFGAFGGRRDLMQHLDPFAGGQLSQAGTHNNNPVTLSAGIAGARRLFTPDRCLELNRRGDELRGAINAVAKSEDAGLQATGLGSVLSTHWHNREITKPEDVESPNSPRRRLFHLAMLNRGLVVAPRGMMALSTLITDSDTARFLEELRRFLRKYRHVVGRTV